MLELGQPTHAYRPRPRSAGPALRVRRAVPGERLELLDGTRPRARPGLPGARRHRRGPRHLRRRRRRRSGSRASWAARRPRSATSTTAVVLEAAWFDADGRRPQREAPPAAHRGLRALRARLRPDGVRPRRGAGSSSCSPRARPDLRVAAGRVDARGDAARRRRCSPSTPRDLAARLGRRARARRGRAACSRRIGFSVARARRRRSR